MVERRMVVWVVMVRFKFSPCCLVASMLVRATRPRTVGAGTLGAGPEPG